MIEQSRVILSEQDVIGIIADAYCVQPSDVEIKISEGDPQYPQLSMCAIVNKR